MQKAKQYMDYEAEQFKTPAESAEVRQLGDIWGRVAESMQATWEKRRSLESEAKPQKLPRGQNRWLRHEVQNIRDLLIKEHPDYALEISAFADPFARGEGAEWVYLVTQLTVAYRENPEVLRKFWHILAASTGKSYDGYTIGIAGQAGAAQLFEKLGFAVATTTPEVDVKFKADLFIDGKPLQIKARKGEGFAAITVTPKQFKGIQTPGFIVRINAKYFDELTGTPSKTLIESAKKALHNQGVELGIA